MPDWLNRHLIRRVFLILCALLFLFLLLFGRSILELLRVSSEGSNKGKLGLLRQELEAHKSAHAGIPPAGLDEILRPPTLPEFPSLWQSNPAAPHRRTSAWRPAAQAADSGEWAYEVSASTPGWVYIDCTHTDMKGNNWDSY